MTLQNRLIDDFRRRFDEVYDACILGGGFVETDEYYRIERERYWRSLQFFCSLNIPRPARILEIGGGQLALLCTKIFGDECSVGDISEDFVGPIKSQGIKFVQIDLMKPSSPGPNESFDAIILLEVIEHLPVPAYVVFENLKQYLKPSGILYLTTPNLFRLRNLVRMISGREFLDRFSLPEPGKSLGHQLEYSADQLEWQLGRAGLETVFLKHDELGRVGHSPKVRLARRLLAPLRLRPLWRDGLVVAARKPLKA